MVTHRGTTNRNARGSSYERRRRRAWLLATFGDGVKAPCYRCETPLDADTLTVDRIKPGIEGGTYRRNNIRPACGSCNSETGGQLGGERRRQRKVRETSMTQARDILAAIESDGPMTVDEFIAKRSAEPNDWAPAFSKLRKAGLTQRTGDVRKTRRNRDAFVIGLTEAGHALVNA